MYIYHALINTLSAHIIHINLNMIFYIHVEHSPTKTKYYKKQNKNALQTNTKELKELGFSKRFVQHLGKGILLLKCFSDHII